MRNTLKFIWKIMQVIIIIHVILVTSLMFFQNKYGFSQIGNYVIYNADRIDHKNIPTIKDGDLVIVKVADQLKKGDDAYYYAVINDKYFIVSDVVVKVLKDNDKYLYTVDKEDPIVISSSRVIGNKSYRCPNIGKILEIVESKVGFIFLVLLPIMLVFIYQVYQFLLILRFEKISEDEKNKDSVVDGEIL